MSGKLGQGHAFHDRGNSMSLTSGQAAPNIHALLPNGRVLSLADFHGRPLILIFLRHLG